MKSRLQAIAAAITLALTALLFTFGIARANTDPPSGTVVGTADRTMYASTPIPTPNSTTYSPVTIGGTVVGLTRYYQSGEAFVTADFASTGVLTVSVQSSTDQTNWADAYTVNANNTPVPLQVVITNDGTNYMRIPFAGYYTRFKMVNSDSVTPLIRMVLRNNGGS